MTEIYLIRHCEAKGNSKRIFQGLADFDISETGAKQLKYLGERFKNIDVDKIYSSPLKRAFKTAQAVADVKGLKVIPWDGIREINLGVLEGQNYDKVFEENPDLEDKWTYHPEDFAPENGETMREAYERIWEEILKIAKLNKGKKIVAATHGGVTRCLMCRLLSGSIEHLSETPWSSNTAVALIKFDGCFNPSLEFFNDASHLPESLIPPTSKPQNISKKG